MAGLELIKPISDSGGQPVMLLPLSFVVLVSMVKDIFEDYQRHRADDIENSKLTLQGNPLTEAFEEVPWREVQVGRILKVQCDQEFPADLIIINSSGPKGICYIETKNLDGESNLKHRQAVKESIAVS
mmetsp:Transcript_29398/g.28516  ORF Transcript_29398/g.28516 Transcript_29398/m.28516 type:complete len:128 (+) Transcript_29398:415-798(+)